jgi:HSP20 family protein
MQRRRDEMTAIIRRSPARTMRVIEPFYRPFSLLDEVERMTRGIFDGDRPLIDTELFHGMDVYRDKGDLIVRAELPGIKKKDMEISLEDDVLTIKAEKIHEETPEDAERYISERRFGSYSRKVTLPFPVDEEKITATYKNGLLEMRLPKAEEARPKRIDINVK